LIIQEVRIPREAALGPFLRGLQTLVTCYPRFIAPVIIALVNEGKLFAKTPEGQRQQRELSGSAWVEKGRILWETCGLDRLLEEPSATGLQYQSISDAIRTLHHDIAEADLETILTRTMFGSSSIRHDNSLRASSRVRDT